MVRGFGDPAGTGTACWEAKVNAEVKTYFTANKTMVILPLNQQTILIVLILDRDLLQLQGNAKTKQLVEETSAPEPQRWPSCSLGA